MTYTNHEVPQYATSYISKRTRYLKGMNELKKEKDTVFSTRLFIVIARAQVIRV
jgi:hypothetical protein